MTSKGVSKPRSPCDVCGKLFASPSSLYLHKRLHSGDHPYKCRDCGKRFRYLPSYSVHIVSAHGHGGPTTNVDKYTCGICNRRFTNFKNLQLHKQIHLQNTDNAEINNSKSQTNKGDILKSEFQKGEYLKKITKKGEHLKIYSQKSDNLKSQHIKVDHFKSQTQKDDHFKSQTKKGDHFKSQHKKGDHFKSQTQKDDNFKSQTQKGDHFKSQTKKGDHFKSQTQKDDHFKSQTQKGDHFKDQTKKGDHFKSQTQKGDHFKSQTQKGDHFKSQTKKGDNFKSQTQKGDHFKSQTQKDDQLERHKQKDEYLKTLTQREDHFKSQTQKGDHAESQTQPEAYLTSKNRKSGLMILNKQTKQDDHAHKQKQKYDKFSCVKCDKHFNRIERLSAHQEQHISLVPKPYKCDHENCDASFTHLSSLTYHQRTHTSMSHSSMSTLVRCPKCNKMFKSPTMLRFHLARSHKDNSGHTCVDCGQTFIKRYKLELHMRTHESGSSYSCGKCEAVLPTLDSFVKHKQTHMKPTQCGICEKRFSDKTSRDRHLRTHSGIRPYKCTKCGRTFAQSHHLKKHYSSVHLSDGPQYKCDQCSAVFSKQHLVQHHVMIDHMTESERNKMMKSSKFPVVTVYPRIVGKSPEENRVEKATEINKMTKSGSKRPFTKPVTQAVSDDDFDPRKKSQMTRWHPLTIHPKQYFCDICGAGFTRMWNLNGHISKHVATDDDDDKNKNDKDRTIQDDSTLVSKYPRLSSVLTETLDDTADIDDVESQIVTKPNTTSHTTTSLRDKEDALSKDPEVQRHVVRMNILSNYYVPRKMLNVTETDEITGKTKYVCEVCTASFTLRDNLVRHIRNRPFDHGYYLKKRAGARINRDIEVVKVPLPDAPIPKRYDEECACDVCGNKYPRRANMMSHRWRHTDIEFSRAGVPKILPFIYTSHLNGPHVGIVSSSTVVEEGTDRETVNTNISKNKFDIGTNPGTQTKHSADKLNSNKKKTAREQNKGTAEDIADKVEESRNYEDFDRDVDSDKCEDTDDVDKDDVETGQRVQDTEATLVNLVVGENSSCISCSLPILPDQKTITCQLCCHRYCLSCSGVSTETYDLVYADDSSRLLWMCKICRPLFPKLTCLTKHLGDFEKSLNKRLEHMNNTIFNAEVIIE